MKKRPMSMSRLCSDSFNTMPSSWLAHCSDLARHASPLVFWMTVSGGGLALGGCCYLWVNALSRSRLIADTPTSKLRSAAQGYVELEGYARMMPGEPIYAPLSGKPCVWYRYSVQQKGRDSDGWYTVESGVSESIFHLVDETSLCVVDPDGAEITPSVKLVWRGDSPRPLHTPNKTGFWYRFFSFGNYRYMECRLREYDPLYAIGQFVGAGDHESLSINEAARDLLATWKRDKLGLLQRFDRDRNGEIDLVEWEEARQAAEREVIATWRERQQQNEVSLLKKPPGGKPYILSSLPQDRLIAHYRAKTWLGLAGIAILVVLMACVVRGRFG